MLLYIQLHCTAMAHSRNLVCWPSMQFYHRSLNLLSLLCLLHRLWFQTAMKTMFSFALTWNWNRDFQQLFPATLPIFEVSLLYAQCYGLSLETDALDVLGFDMRFLFAHSQCILHQWVNDIDNVSSISCLE
jgi:hypothetical protein